MSEKGPVYGIELITELPLGVGGMVQAMPGRSDLEQVRKVNERVAAGYEVLLWHYRKLESDLSAAKAATACPVKFDGVYANSADEAVVWFEETGKAEQFADWLRKMKNKTPPAE